MKVDHKHEKVKDVFRNGKTIAVFNCHMIGKNLAKSTTLAMFSESRDAIKPLLAICFRPGPLLVWRTRALSFSFLCPLMMHDICYYFNSHNVVR